MRATSHLFDVSMKRLLYLFSLIVSVALLIPACVTVEIPTAEGLRWRVFQAGLPRVDNLALSPTGELFATLELAHKQGKLVSIHNGHVVTLLEGLDRPDGLALAGGKLYVTEEVRQGRVLQYDLATGKSATLVYLDNPEGIVVLPDGSLLITEDTRDGRLMRLSPERKLTVVARDLARPEGLRRGADGTVYIAETGSGRVLAYQNKKFRTVADHLNEPDQLAIDQNGDIWIAEDADPGRILRVRHGKPEVMIRGLVLPQGMVFDRQGRLYVAEQGKNRILLFTFQYRK